jgi:hypothetical protein
MPGLPSRTPMAHRVATAKFKVERDAIWRHWQNHVTDEAKASYLCGPADMERLAQKAADEGDSVLDYLKFVAVHYWLSLRACRSRATRGMSHT